MFAHTQPVPDWLGPEGNPLTLAELSQLAKAHYMRTQVCSRDLQWAWAAPHCTAASVGVIIFFFHKS